jgi:DHA1 family inner membrane transport protein
VGIAFGSFAGGVAVGAFTVSTAVIAGVVLAVIAIPVAWASGFLTPPAAAAASLEYPRREVVQV